MACCYLDNPAQFKYMLGPIPINVAINLQGGKRVENKKCIYIDSLSVFDWYASDVVVRI